MSRSSRSVKVLLQIARFVANFCLHQCAVVILQNGHGLIVLDLQRLTTAGSENSSVASTKYCNNSLKIADLKINIIKKLISASGQNSRKTHFKVLSR